MTKEQEKAIKIEENKSREILKNYIENDDFYNLYKKQNKQGEVGGTHIDFCKAIETVLNMLKEKDKEIEKLKEDNKNVWILNENMSKRHLADILKIKEKDKQIDLILEFLSKRDLGYYKKEAGGEILGIMRRYNKEDWKEYFERKSEDGEN